ncbi:VirK family protein [Xylophilus ampelinus]|uniref:VirK protein n=1 Tax=Xylophilus ampelinus TaxID=54067 RepID=A0A318SKY2_9BURK|nr:VirK family protein [Xylophilus ampelinus]MCS4510596.1 VirK family protein [Xylophilus ampelinus]PYE77778.1 VirK protein [Xylophilus ampelinus]
MRRTAAFLLAFSSSLLALPALAQVRLDQLADIERALAAGGDVAVSIDLSQCTGKDGARPTQTRGGLRIGAYRIVEDGTLSFSDAHFTVARDGQPIQQLLRYQVRPDRSIDFTMFVFDLPSYQARSAVLAYRCGINQGIQFHVR